MQYEDDGVKEGVADESTPQPEQDVVKGLMKEYNAAVAFDKDARKQYQTDRDYAAGLNDTTWASGANLIGTYIDILISFLYARDPAVSCRPAPYVGEIQPPDAEDFAETLQIVISRLWKDGRLKFGARKQIRSTLSVGPGWFKALVLSESKENPEVKKRIADVRDNIAALKAIDVALAETDIDETERNRQVAEQELQMESLAQNLEVIHRYSLAIDFVKAEDMQVSLDVDDLCDYRDAGWVANAMYVRKDEVPGRFPRLTKDDVKTAVCYYRQAPKKRDTISEVENRVESAMAAQFTISAPSGATGDSPEFLKIIELWDKRDNHIKTFVDGVTKWAKEPFPPPYNTTRFYPFFLLALFLCDGLRHPQSLSYRLHKLQDEYNHARSNMRLVRERSVPGVLFLEEQLDKKTMDKIVNSVAQEYVGVKTTASIDDIRKLFSEKPIGRFDPRIYDVEPILRDMERISGVQEALSASVQTAKTATEAEIQQTGFTSRTSADRDTLEDMLTDLAQYSAELAIQCMPTAYVQRIAGPGSFWPEGLPFEEVVTLVEVDIEAGSSGKPHTEAQRQSWATMLPLIKELQLQIYQAELSGQVEISRALKALLRESLKRLDDRVSLDKLIPQTPQALPVPVAGVPGAPGAAPVAPGAALAPVTE